MIDTSILFKPFKVNGLELPNRIVMSPMGRGFASGGVIDRAFKPYANELLYTLH